MLLIPLSWPLIFHLLLHNTFRKLLGVAFPTLFWVFWVLISTLTLPNPRSPQGKGSLWQSCICVWQMRLMLVPFLGLIPKHPHRSFPKQGWILQSCLMAPSTLLFHTLQQMVHLNTGRVPQLIALDLPFFHFIWARSGQPCLHRYVNIWMVNKNRMANVEPPFVVRVGFLNSHKMN